VYLNAENIEQIFEQGGRRLPEEKKEVEAVAIPAPQRQVRRLSAIVG
jgi:hypothetical protein